MLLIRKVMNLKAECMGNLAKIDLFVPLKTIRSPVMLTLTPLGAVNLAAHSGIAVSINGIISGGSYVE